MRVKIKYAAGGNVDVFIDVNRTEDVKVARRMAAAALEDAFDKPFPEGRLTLLFGGKQLANGMKMHEYGVKHNDSFLVHLKPPTVAVNEPEGSVASVETPISETTVAQGVVNGGLSSPIPNELPKSDAQAIDAISARLKGSDVLGGATVVPAADGNDGEEVLCGHCDNKSASKCNYCGCVYCGLKDDECNTLACDECGRFYHMRCLPTPLTELPEGDWYCEYCKNDPNLVISGEKKLDLSKTRKAKMPSATQTKNWGGGMACAGASKTCTIVPKNHVGSIPGVHVGQSWRFRIHVSGAGVHRPPVGGIAGSSTVPAVSIVLAGGYPEDEDRGDEFTYTGSGGYDLSGNKRVAKVQTFDQELTRQNRSLALACAAEIDEENGATAMDWKMSSPIRVCRSYKIAKKHPEYAPAEGVRYDGLYRIAKYWKEKGESGHYVWRYLFRRDDPEPAPWTPEGIANIERWGLELYDPDNGSSAPASGSKSKAGADQEPSTKRKQAGKAASGTKKANKVYTCTPSRELLEMIRLDTSNTRMWATMAEGTYPSESSYLEALSESALVCPICQELVQQPVTTPCGHNICNPCLCKAMKMYGIICPICRHDISSMGSVAEVRTTSNQNLVTILKSLISSYGNGWEVKPKVTSVQRALRSGMAVDE